MIFSKKRLIGVYAVLYVLVGSAYAIAWMNGAFSQLKINGLNVSRKTVFNNPMSEYETQAAVARIYQNTVWEVIFQKNRFRKKYRNASVEERDIILNEAKVYLMKTMKEKMIPLWLTTDYDYNGMTEVPRRGSIACGYLVYTFVKHLGFQIDRMKLAQSAAYKAIRSLTTKQDRFFIEPSNDPQKSLEERIKSIGYGIYIIGLDFHTGFIINDGKGVRFFHSQERYVTVEPVNWSRAIEKGASRGIYVGRLFNDQMMKRWID